MNKSLLITLVVLISILILISGGLLFWLVNNKNSLSNELLPSIKPVSTPIPTSTLAPLSQENESDSESNSDLLQVRQAFAQKYDKDLNEVKVTIKEKDDPYMSGGISFSGEISGGWFLAYHDNGDWIIVADGNGTVMCEKIEPYNFPTTMAPECWDEVNGELITR